MFKKYIQSKLERSVRKYFKKHPEVKLVVVTGSVGKTSTKVAIGTVLSESLRVRMHDGNHNSEISAPLAILGVAYPSNIRSLGQWRSVFRAVRQRIKQPADVDVIVQELGTDAPGQIPHFGTYLNPDIAVVTAVSAEHMEFFKTMDVVAAEELSAANFSKTALINRDDIPGQYAANITNANLNTYGATDVAEFRFEIEDWSFDAGYKGRFVAPGSQGSVSANLNLLGEHSLRAAVGAGAVGVILGVPAELIVAGLAKVRPVSGRMNILEGQKHAIIIDDTYNSSPLAAMSALRALYQISAPQKIAVLGSMNELGESSAAEHTALGKLCDPSQLAHVIVVGEQAEKYLAPAARANGCHVVSARHAIEAGGIAHKYIEEGGAVLFKGSEGGVYLEEAVKVVLHTTADSEKLVRQSPQWQKRKQAFFESFN